MDMHLALLALWIACTVITVSAVKKGKIMSSFNELSKNGGLVVAFIVVGTVAGIAVYGAIITGADINSARILVWHSLLAALITSIDTLVIMKKLF